ncbi:TetR family transcriptional regulator [Rhizobium sp. 1399]|uniref:TetR/AcrR family transcriptional regulator n=1 Tax=Rhizobium sp. 1399 TaxID=2817758 RepID=UPI0028649411|nr:TetR family transcriptional regulator [Rhizobium sp. 1399]MDR6671219.1 AcrR family transcriptional regulator [Rhizobium sp. 1399]
MNQPLKFREVAKRAIREQISAAALARFRDQGFHETTVEHIAADVGMSTRTFFRYFSSKDEVLLEATYAFEDRFLNALQEVLRTDNLWEALGLALRVSTIECRSDVAQHEREVQKLIQNTPSLMARQLEVMDHLQAEAASRCCLLNPQAARLDEGTVHAVVGSAFSCYRTAELRLDVDATSDEAGKALSLLMQALKPVALQD